MDYVTITKEDGSIEDMEVVTVFNMTSSNYNYIIYRSLITGEYFTGKYIGNFIEEINTDLTKEEVEYANGIFKALVGD